MTLNYQTDNNQQDLENQLETEELLRAKRKPKFIAAPFKDDIGEQNSYVNVIIHLLHYIPQIPEYVEKFNFKSEKQYYLLHYLQELLKKYAKLTNSEEFEKIPETERYCDVYELRKEMEKIYKGEEMFQLGTTGDPADLLFIFLNAFHSFSMKAHSLKYSIDKECIPLCPSHEFIWLNLVQQFECCSCKSTSDVMKFDYNYFMYELKMKELLSKVQKMKKLAEFQNKFFIFSKEINVCKIKINKVIHSQKQMGNVQKNAKIQISKKILY